VSETTASCGMKNHKVDPSSVSGQCVGRVRCAVSLQGGGKARRQHTLQLRRGILTMLSNASRSYILRSCSQRFGTGTQIPVSSWTSAWREIMRMCLCCPTARVSDCPCVQPATRVGGEWQWSGRRLVNWHTNKPATATR